MKHIRVLLQQGIKKRLSEVELDEKVIGIILRKSKKVVSLNLYPPTEFSKTDLFRVKKMSIGEQEMAEKDFNGLENTKRLMKYEILKFRLEKNEYLPSLGELKEAVLFLPEINQVRKKLGLDIIQDCWFWSSTLRDKDSVWVVDSDGSTGWYGWYDVYRSLYCVVAFLRK
jgi:hypothetical protein